MPAENLLQGWAFSVKDRARGEKEQTGNSVEPLPPVNNPEGD